MSLCSWSLPLSVGLLLLSLGEVLSADEKLAAQLARLDGVVAPAEERQALAGMVSSDIQRRRQELNDQNTAASG